jgi:two-component system sensor histidine kinase CreC
MSKRSRIFFGLLLAYALGTALVLYHVVAGLDPRYRESAEESLVETSQLLASLIEQDVRADQIDTGRIADLLTSVKARSFQAQIFNLTKTQVELRVYVTNRQGTVIYDSEGTLLGQDFSQWRDVNRTLQGQYGARTTLEVANDPRSAVMYMAAPVRRPNAGHTTGQRDDILGSVTVAKPVQTFGQFVVAARSRTLYAGMLSVLAVLVLTAALSVWLVRPFGLIQDYARYVKAQSSFQPTRLLRHAWDLLRAAYDEMRDALAGRNYVADYVQTLTHEVKSPLSAIRGAAELLQEPMPEPQRQRFLNNIQQETRRIQEMVDRMMELTTLENQRVLQDPEPVPLMALMEDLVHAYQGIAAARRIQLRIHQDIGTHQPAINTEGDPFLLRRALSNLIDNALDFSPSDAQVVLTLSRAGRWARIAVQDAGPGIPSYAKDKIFEKFYSLARPHSDKKSTGLGLRFVQEIMNLHRGRITLENRAPTQGRGAVATLWLRVHPH